MNSDLKDLQTHWWALTLRGIVAILFGIAAVFWPGLTLVTLLYIFAAWILVDGIVQIVSGIGRLGSNQLGFLSIVIGLIELGVGIYLLRHPGVSFATLILLIGFMLIVDGVIEAVASLTSRDSGNHKTIAVIVSVAAVLAGILILFQPARSGVAFVWILGLYALISGSMMIAMSLELHKLTFDDTGAVTGGGRTPARR
jgi:uncharacterized membrane protein HdeD (DUF308 family)